MISRYRYQSFKEFDTKWLDRRSYFLLCFCPAQKDINLDLDTRLVHHCTPLQHNIRKYGQPVLVPQQFCQRSTVSHCKGMTLPLLYILLYIGQIDIQSGQQRLVSRYVKSCIDELNILFALTVIITLPLLYPTDWNTSTDNRNKPYQFCMDVRNSTFHNCRL